MKEPLIVYDMRYMKLCDLNDDSGFSAKNIEESQQLNSIPQLTFEIPLSNTKVQYIYNENLVLFKNEYYRIKTPVIKHEEDGKTSLSVNCSHLSETLQSNVITMSETTPKNVIELMKIALAYDNGMPTLGWSVGNVTVDLIKMRGLESSEQSSFSNLVIIAQKYEGILVFNSISKTVDLKPILETAKPDFELSINKNLKNISITYDTSSMVTRLYCFGGNDVNGNEISIIPIIGKAYVENYDYFYRLGYNSTDIANSPELFVKTNIWRDSNYYLPLDLYNDGVKEIAKVAFPKIDVTVEALDLSQFPEYASVNLELGDAINVRDEDLGITFICNITGRTINYEEEHILNIEVTNQINYKSIISDLFSKVATVSQVVTSGGTVKGSSIDAINTSQIRDITAKYATFEYLSANYIDATNLASQYALINNLEANYASIEHLEANYVDITELNANYLKVIDANIKYATIDNLSANYLTAVNADLKFATIDNLSANYVSIETLTSQYATVDQLNAIYLKATDANIKYAQITELESYYLKTENADIKYATIENLVANYIKAVDADIKYATINNLNANYITANDIEVKYLSASDANIKFATILSLQTAVADIGTLTTSLGVIETLVNGNLTSANIQSLNLTSSNTTIANAMIKDAMIDNLSVNKLLAGDISTNKFNIKSDGGNLTIIDNTIQISDDTKVRVQIGKDALGDYNMYVWDLNGNLMFDATGIKEDAIKSAIIRDDMVSPIANISAEKINITTLFDVINNDNTHTVKGSKILLDTQGQTLQVAFNSMKTSVENIESKKIYRLEVVSSNGNIFKNNRGTTTLSAKVYSWDSDITDTILASNFQWHRKSLNTIDDAYWDGEYGMGKKEIVITPADITDSTSFSFEVTLPD